MSNEKIVLGLKEGLTVKDTVAIPIFFRNRLEEVVTALPVIRKTSALFIWKMKIIP